MPLPVLLDDALRLTADGCGLRLSLPWIRSLPIASLRDLAVTIDTAMVPVPDFTGRSDWWYIQDRVELAGPAVTPGVHEVAVAFTLDVPYLDAGPDRPLSLPFRETRRLVAA